MVSLLLLWFKGVKIKANVVFLVIKDVRVVSANGSSLSLTPLLSNLAVSTTNTVNLMFNSIKMAKATN